MIMPTLDMFSASDTTGQKTARFRKVPGHMSIGELLDGTVLPRLALPRLDTQQRPISYRARNDRTGRYLHRSEATGEALLEGDRLVLQPQIDAGAAPRAS